MRDFASFWIWSPLCLRDRAICSCRCVCFVIVAAGLGYRFAQADPQSTPGKQPAEAKSGIAAVRLELSRQDDAWDDLDIVYECEYLFPDDKGVFQRSRIHQLRWQVTNRGWERLKMATVNALAVNNTPANWIQEAGFDGEHYTTWDSQKYGSGLVGHQVAHFLNVSESPKTFLFVSGIELGQPVSIAEYLSKGVDGLTVAVGENGLIRVDGPDPFTPENRLALELDPLAGYRPRQFEQFDPTGLLSRYEIDEYVQLDGVRGQFWFPKRGT